MADTASRTLAASLRASLADAAANRRSAPITPDELTRIVRALHDRAEKVEQFAKRRSQSGAQMANQREGLRTEARLCRELADRIKRDAAVTR